MRWSNYVTLTVVGIIGVFFILGFVLGQQNDYTIDGCKATWSGVPRVVSSPYCPGDNETCTSDPNTEKHNALVELLFCACRKAKTNDYRDSKLNNEITTLYEGLTGYSTNVREICEGGAEITKWRY